MEGGLSNIFNWAIGIGGILALCIIIYNGILYTVSAGNESKQKDAIEWIKSVALGFGLLLISYILLNTIDPRVLRPSVRIMFAPDVKIACPQDPFEKIPFGPISINDPDGLLQTQAQKDEAASAAASIYGATHAEVVKDEITGRPILKVYDPALGDFHTFDIGYGWR